MISTTYTKFIYDGYNNNKNVHEGFTGERALKPFRCRALRCGREKQKNSPGVDLINLPARLFKQCFGFIWTV